MSRRRWSLRNRLMLLAGIGTLLAWLGGAAAVLVAAAQESHALYDARLRDVALFILAFGRREIEKIHADQPGTVLLLDASPAVEHRYDYQVWSGSGRLLLASADGPRQPFVPLQTTGHFHRRIGSVAYSIVSVPSDDGAIQVQVAEREDMRDAFLASVDTDLIVLAVLSAALLLLSSGWLSMRTMRPLRQMERQLAERSAADLRSLTVERPPRELEDVIDAINGLLLRFRRSMEAERQFTAAAAHELKTPLAAVRLQAQIAEHARTRAQARSALQGLSLCIDRTARMVDQLLTLAHVDAMGASRVETSRMQLHDVAARVVDDMTPLMRERGIEIETNLQPAEMLGLESGVAAMLRNLVDNALRYSPHRGRVRVASGEQDGTAFVSVDDSGPGIPVHERENVFKRFYRLQTNDEDGCGVGLSIVQCVARVHRARIMLGDSELGGLRAEARFPKQPAQQQG